VSNNLSLRIPEINTSKLIFGRPSALSGSVSPQMLGFQFRANFNLISIVDLPVEVGDLLCRHVVRRNDLAEEADANLALDVAEADVVFGSNTDLK